MERKPDGQTVGYLYVNGTKIPLTACYFTVPPNDYIADVFASLPDGGPWRGNRNIQ